MVLFAPAALIAASALGLHQFFALWRVFASAVNDRSGSPAWKTVQPGAPQLAAPPVHWSAYRACSSEADKRGLRECTGRECKHHQNKPHTRAARCRGACDTDLRRARALLTAEALRVQFSALSRLDFAQLTCSCGCRHVMDVAPRVGCVAACTCPRLRRAATCVPQPEQRPPNSVRRLHFGNVGGAGRCRGHCVMASLLFSPLESSVSSSFWTELARLKLDEMRLSELPRGVVGASSAHKHIAHCSCGDAALFLAHLLFAQGFCRQQAEQRLRRRCTWRRPACSRYACS